MPVQEGRPGNIGQGVDLLRHALKVVILRYRQLYPQDTTILTPQAPECLPPQEPTIYQAVKVRVIVVRPLAKPMPSPQST